MRIDLGKFETKIPADKSLVGIWRFLNRPLILLVLRMFLKNVLHLN